MTQISNRAEALFGHIRALERLQEAKDEANADYNQRKGLAKEDGFDTNVIAAILKRRKNGRGQTVTFDELLREYEDMIEDREDAERHGMERLVPPGASSVTISTGGQSTTIARTEDGGFVATLSTDEETDHYETDHDPDGSHAAAEDRDTVDPDQHGVDS